MGKHLEVSYHDLCSLVLENRKVGGHAFLLHLESGYWGLQNSETSPHPLLSETLPGSLLLLRCSAPPFSLSLLNS